ncbi:MAG: GNAT family N-acetyltransferase [Nitrospirae bacterium]|nr:GNAT family N-acetyltransferase [Nitrospirota bacterium]
MLCAAEITIRQARSSDIAPMCDLLAGLFRIETDFKPNIERQRQGLNMLINAGDSAVLYVAESGEEILGMCSIQTLISTAQGGHVGLLEDLIVRVDQRGKGIGTALISEGIKWCGLRNISRIQLLRDSKNSAALNFYTKRGWSKTQLECMRMLL